MELDLEFGISVKDMVNQLYWQDEPAVRKLIKDLDKRMGDCGFTLDLLHYFADALRAEGYTIDLEIKEP